MDIKIIISIIIMGIITDNVVLVKAYGICPFLGVSKKTNSAVGMGLAVMFVMGISSLVTWGIYQLLVVAELTYLSTVVYILIIASVVQLIDIVLKKLSPSLYNSLGVYLPLITTNCAVLFLVNANTVSTVDIKAFASIAAEGVNIFYAFINGLAVGFGFMVALVLMSGIRMKLERAQILKSAKGFPITLIAAGIMAMAFAGLAGLTLF